jgi:hypothetical protein
VFGPGWCRFVPAGRRSGRVPGLGFGSGGHVACRMCVVGAGVVPGLARLRCPIFASGLGGRVPGCPVGIVGHVTVHSLGRASVTVGCCLAGYATSATSSRVMARQIGGQSATVMPAGVGCAAARFEGDPHRV